ncbi:MAG: hypothetical protein PX637_12650, partial [Microcystis sp. M53601_WE4]|nr:hypothetical protein [Microcystis sp. M53601_WE4]
MVVGRRSSGFRRQDSGVGRRSSGFRRQEAIGRSRSSVVGRRSSVVRIQEIAFIYSPFSPHPTPHTLHP